MQPPLVLSSCDAIRDGEGCLYIVIIGWLYVVVLMAVTEKTLTAGLLTLFGYGLLPVVLLAWMVGLPLRWRRRGSGRVGQLPDQPDGADPKHDQ